MLSQEHFKKQNRPPPFLTDGYLHCRWNWNESNQFVQFIFLKSDSCQYTAFEINFEVYAEFFNGRKWFSELPYYTLKHKPFKIYITTLQIYIYKMHTASNVTEIHVQCISIMCSEPCQHEHHSASLWYTLTGKYAWVSSLLMI